MDNRTKMIESLIDNDISDIQQEAQENNNYFLYHVLKDGWRGYNDFTDKELSKELQDREIV